MAKAPDYTVIRDTREREGYHFSKFDKCLGMVVRKLDTGDYTLVGLEDKICIERKGCVEEVAINFGKKKKQFLAEIERMKEFPHRFILLEFTLEDLMKFPQDTRIPNKSSVKITGKYILRTLMEFQVHDDVHVVFCGDKNNAFLYANSLFKRINEKYTTGRQK